MPATSGRSAPHSSQTVDRPTPPIANPGRRFLNSHPMYINIKIRATTPTGSDHCINIEAAAEVALLTQRAIEYLFPDQERTDALAQIAKEYPLSAHIIAELAPRRDIANDASIENWPQAASAQAPA